MNRLRQAARVYGINHLSRGLAQQEGMRSASSVNRQLNRWLQGHYNPHPKSLALYLRALDAAERDWTFVRLLHVRPCTVCGVAVFSKRDWGEAEWTGCKDHRWSPFGMAWVWWYSPERRARWEKAAPSRHQAALPRPGTHGALTAESVETLRELAKHLGPPPLMDEEKWLEVAT